MPGKLFIFSAPSGSGKSTIVQHLMKLDLDLSFSVSATSRKPRKGEHQGREYHFMTPAEFREKIRNDDFIEWEEVYSGQYYGTLKSEVDKIWSRNQHAVFDIDVLGGLNLKRLYGDQALAIFIEPPSLNILEERLRSRGTDDPSSLDKRLKKAETELQYAKDFDVVLLNDTLEIALKEAEELVKNFLIS